MTESGAHPQAHTLRGQAVANRIVRGLLRTPLICRIVGRRLVTVYVTGRRSGRRYAIPVAYTRDGADLLVGSPFPWTRNLRTGDRVALRLKGRLRQADVKVFTGEDDVVELYGQMCRDNRVFARFNEIGVDPAGVPDPDALHAAWSAGARALRFSPR